MSKIARKLVLSIVTVVLTVFALGTTTFAWFTLTNTAQVQPFQAQIIADTGIEIAVGTYVDSPQELAWRTTLTTAEMNTFIETKYAGAFRFNHLTSSNGVTFDTIGTSGIIPATGGWLEIPLHFRSNSADRIIWTAVTLSTPSVISWRVDQQFTHVDGLVKSVGSFIDVDPSNSMRISITGLVNEISNTVAYEKPGPGAYNNIVLNGLTATDLYNGGVGYNGAHNYYFEKSGELPGGLDESSIISLVTTIQSITYTEGVPATYIPIVDLGDGVVQDAGAAFFGSVVIRIWFEGWDPNAFNAALNGMINSSFTFVGVEKP